MHLFAFLKQSERSLTVPTGLTSKSLPFFVLHFHITVPLSCNVDLDAVAASDKPADPAFVARYQKLIGELLYLSVNTMPEIGYVMSCLTRYKTKPTQ